MPGIPARMAHDYVRCGTTSLFAAIDVASGRFHLHFTPTSSSWMNLAGRWFAELTNRKLCHCARRSVTELEADIGRWITPEPFVWAKTADEILDTLAAYCRRINDSGQWGIPGRALFCVEGKTHGNEEHPTGSTWVGLAGRDRRAATSST